MLGWKVAKMSLQMQHGMGLRSTERRGRKLSADPIRRSTRSGLFKNRSTRASGVMNRKCADVSSCSDVRSMFLGQKLIMLSMQQNPGEKVRSLVKMMDQQQHLFQQIHRSPIMQLQARRFRSLFALAHHLDSTSTTATAAKFADCLASAKEPQEPAIQLGAELSQMSLSS